MKFEKATDHPMKSARILLHTGVGLRRYRYERSNYLEQDVSRIAYKLSKERQNGYTSKVDMFPERSLCEHDALDSIMRKINRALTENEVLSVVTDNTWLAQTIVDLMVRQGLSCFLHVFSWSDERLCHMSDSDRAQGVIHGWFPDQNTPVATQAFELAPRKLDYLEGIDFTAAMHAALTHS
jgi:hypothetical protein